MTSNAVTSNALRRALVGEHREKYHTMVWFRQAVDSLAAFLPVLVDGLALQAEAQVRDLQAAMRASVTEPDQVEQLMSDLKDTIERTRRSR